MKPDPTRLLVAAYEIRSAVPLDKGDTYVVKEFLEWGDDNSLPTLMEIKIEIRPIRRDEITLD